ncbi:hypothetical protein ANANG_G00264570 [Anguilla anguilla]|uniref:Uncharacterized protein n=1 Tax=Anguilla anguilla TaxID=7936 RepID=A0A9D3RL89_ANGAN|nr:hypothetical protein ANANG_G00264570 [Anguilla anguilla]
MAVSVKTARLKHQSCTARKLPFATPVFNPSELPMRRWPPQRSSQCPGRRGSGASLRPPPAQRCPPASLPGSPAPSRLSPPAPPGGTHRVSRRLPLPCSESGPRYRGNA